MTTKNDYVIMDDYGLVTVKCMNCDVEVGGRSYIEMTSKADSTKKVNVIAFRYHSNFKQEKYDLEDGNSLMLVLCEECRDKQPLDLVDVMDKIRRGWSTEMRWGKKSAQEIATHERKTSKWKLKGKSKK